MPDGLRDDHLTRNSIVRGARPLQGQLANTSWHFINAL